MIPFLDATPMPPSNDLFHWVATYEDGSTFEEYVLGAPVPAIVGLPPAPRYLQIDQERLHVFQLIPNYPRLSIVTVEVHPEDGERLVYFKRTHRELNAMTEEEVGRQYSYAVGIARNDDPDPILTFIFMNGTVYVGRDPLKPR